MLDRKRFLLLFIALLASACLFAAVRQPASLRQTLSARRAPRDAHTMLSASRIPVRPLAPTDSFDISNRRARDLSKNSHELVPTREGELPSPPLLHPERIPIGLPALGDSQPVFRRSLDQGDDYCPGYVIPGTPFQDIGTLNGMHDDVTSSCSEGSGTGDVIYQFTPQTTGYYLLLFESESSNTIFSVRTGGACPGDVELNCDNGTPPNGGARPSSTLMDTGITYYITVDRRVSEQYYGHYELQFTGPYQCLPAFSITAPGTVSGNTCFAGEHCPAVPGDDEIVRVVIPERGRWKFSLCDGQNWYAGMYLRSQCCGPIITHDDGVGSCAGGRRPQFTLEVDAGEYFLDIEGGDFYDHQCGPWTLTVSQPAAPLNDNCEDVVPVPLPAEFTGDNTDATGDCAFTGDRETWHAFTLDQNADVVVDYCGTSSAITLVRDALMMGCPCYDERWSDARGYYPCDGTNILRLLYFDLPPGTYFIPMVSAESSHGAYRISVRAQPSCHIESRPGDVIECAETADTTQITHDCDGGCYSVPPQYQYVSLSDTIYGRCFTYRSSDGYDYYRDTDWYRFTITDTTAVTINWYAEFAAQGVILEEHDCGPARQWGGFHSLESCLPLTCTSECLPPGSYDVVLMPLVYYGLFYPENYRLSFSASSCHACEVAMQPGDVSEGEPDCYTEYNDVTNAGCEFEPEHYSPLSVGETVYGNAGVWVHSYGATDSTWFRDTDWYRVELTERAILSLTVETEFPAYVALAYGCDDDGDEALLDDVIPPCTPTTLRVPECLRPHTYYAFITPADWGPYPCGSHYRATLNGEPCSTCDTTLARSGDLIEQEPVCASTSVDTVNGGCNSDPPVFGQILTCGQTIAGTSGTLGSTRDTDWYPITIPGPDGVVLSWCVFAQFPPLITILEAGDCESLVTRGGVVAGNACDTVCVSDALAPGDYWLYVAPNDFGFTPCSSEYLAWAECSPCQPDTVHDVTVRRVDNVIRLRWSNGPGFFGTYNVYASMDQSNWTLLRSHIEPGSAYNHTMFVDSTALEGFKAYYVTSSCP